VVDSILIPPVFDILIFDFVEHDLLFGLSKRQNQDNFEVFGDIQQFEQFFISLASGENPIIDSAPASLQEFVDLLSEHSLTLRHYLNTPLSNIAMLKARQGGSKFPELLAASYQYKAFMRELTKRWSQASL